MNTTTPLVTLLRDNNGYDWIAVMVKPSVVRVISGNGNITFEEPPLSALENSFKEMGAEQLTVLNHDEVLRVCERYGLLDGSTQIIQKAYIIWSTAFVLTTEQVVELRITLGDLVTVDNNPLAYDMFRQNSLTRIMSWAERRWIASHNDRKSVSGKIEYLGYNQGNIVGLISSWRYV